MTMSIEKIKSSFRRLQWKLTLSYTAVTVGSLFVVVLMLGYLLFSKSFIPIEIYKRVVTPEEWIREMHHRKRRCFFHGPVLHSFWISDTILGPGS